MRVLWLPHSPTLNEAWEGSRQFHLWRCLRDRHEFHWVRWEQGWKGQYAPQHWGSIRESDHEIGRQYTIVLPPNLWRLFVKDYPRQPMLLLHQALFQRALRQILRQVQPEVAIYSHTHWATGFPPFDIGVPILFDHVDETHDWVEKRYVTGVDTIVTITPSLMEALQPGSKPHAIVPNGVDCRRYVGLDREKAKKELGLSGKTVVSLIGLTCSESYYFVDAVAALQQRRPNIALLIVGGGARRDAIVAKAQALGVKDVLAPGALPNAAVPPYFAATDVGLYPGENNRYFYRASPLKIVEYTAVGAQVVSSPVQMFEQGWPNVRIAADNTDAFAVAIEEALDSPQEAPDVTPYDWQTLADQFDGLLRALPRKT